LSESPENSKTVQADVHAQLARIVIISTRAGYTQSDGFFVFGMEKKGDVIKVLFVSGEHAIF